MTSYVILSEVHSKQSIQVDLSPNFKVLMKDLYISYRRKKAATVIWRSYLTFHIVLNVMNCPYVCFIVYWSPANYTCLLLGTVGLIKPVHLVLKTHLLTVSALMLVNFQQKKKQNIPLTYCQQHVSCPQMKCTTSHPITESWWYKHCTWCEKSYS